jgi:hypothetical protein
LFDAISSRILATSTAACREAGVGGSPAQSMALAPDRVALAPRAVAWSLWLVTVAAIAIGSFVWAAQRFPAPPIRFAESAGGAAVVPAAIVYSAVFATVGLFLAHHHPRNPIGWMFLLIGLPMALAGLSNWWLRPAVQTNSLGFGHQVAAWLNSSVHLPWVGTLLLLVLLVFPDGRVPSPRWRPVLWFVLGNAMLVAVAAGVEPGTLFWHPDIQNPFAIDDASAPAYLAVRVLAVVGTIVVTALAAFGLLVRYRAGDADRRRQLKWIAYAGLILAIVAAPYAVLRLLLPDSQVNAVFIPVVLVVATLLPLATAVAIMRYRLYDIDVLVSRTLAAAILASLVAALFGVISTLLQRLSVALGGDESDLALIVSTLLVATLIGPVGRIVDRFIDQRLNPTSKPAAAASGTSSGMTSPMSARGDIDRLAGELAAMNERLMHLEGVVGAKPQPSAKPRRRRTPRA